MICRRCGKDDNRIVDCRPVDGGVRTRRRRECQACKGRFTTYEVISVEDLELARKERDAKTEGSPPLA